MTPYYYPSMFIPLIINIVVASSFVVVFTNGMKNEDFLLSQTNNWGDDTGSISGGSVSSGTGGGGGADNLANVFSGNLFGNHFTVFEGIKRQNDYTAFHTHQNEDQYMYIISGNLTFEIGLGANATRFYATAGQHVYKPRGIPHAFWNTHPEPSRFLDISSQIGFELFEGEVQKGIPQSLQFGRSLEVMKEFNFTGIAQVRWTPQELHDAADDPQVMEMFSKHGPDAFNLFSYMMQAQEGSDVYWSKRNSNSNSEDDSSEEEEEEPATESDLVLGATTGILHQSSSSSVIRKQWFFGTISLVVVVAGIIAAAGHLFF